jgi:hypothetical protein
MVLAPSTFEYLKPTQAQLDGMGHLRTAAARYALALEQVLENGPDKTWCLRNHRTTAMWANVAMTRHADGSPRDNPQEN